MSPLEKECVSRFAMFAPDAEIIKWDEDSFDVEAHPYTARAYKDKKWAFVSDYARLKVLYEEGGIYLDTDMWLTRDITELFGKEVFLGKEDETHLSAGIIGATPRNEFIEDALLTYDAGGDRVTIPRVLTKVYNEGNYNITVYDKDFFYPFSAQTIKNFDKKNPPQKSFAVHMWNYSWGNPIIRRVKHLKLYKMIVIGMEKLKVKKFAKRLLGVE
jgi:hypothetical protein